MKSGGQALLPVLMLTAIEEEDTQVQSFDEQADDYITKPFSMVLLGKRITALLRRSGQGVIPDTMTFGEVTVDFSGYSAWDRDGKIELTPREIDLLRLFVEHKGLVLSEIKFSMSCGAMITRLLTGRLTPMLKSAQKMQVRPHHYGKRNRL